MAEPSAAPAPAPGEAPTTPPAAPVTPAAPAAPPAPPPSLDDPNAPPAPAAPPPSSGEGEAITYEPTGDAALDVALGFVGKLGIGGDHPAMAAATNGDFSLLKAHLATMGAKAQGWEQMVALAEQSHGNAVKAGEAKNAAVTAAVHAVAGSAEDWAPVQAWASANADPAEKAEINAMFASGPVGARAAAAMLMQAYAEANGTVVKPAKATAPNAGKDTPTPSHGPMTNRQFADESQKLRSKFGGNFEATAEYQQLVRRALASRG